LGILPHHLSLLKSDWKAISDLAKNGGALAFSFFANPLTYDRLFRPKFGA
jgi:hypothetical protein